MKKIVATAALMLAAWAGPAIACDTCDAKTKTAQHAPMPHAPFPPGMDANHDGKVSLKEHQAFMDGMFRKVDANRDGYITPEEMDAFARKQMEQAMKDMKAKLPPAPPKCVQDGNCSQPGKAKAERAARK